MVVPLPALQPGLTLFDALALKSGGRGRQDGWFVLVPFRRAAAGDTRVSNCPSDHHNYPVYVLALPVRSTLVGSFLAASIFK